MEVLALAASTVLHISARVRDQTGTLIDFNGCQIDWDSMGNENSLTLTRDLPRNGDGRRQTVFRT